MPLYSDANYYYSGGSSQLFAPYYPGSSSIGSSSYTPTSYSSSYNRPLGGSYVVPLSSSYSSPHGLSSSRYQPKLSTITETSPLSLSASRHASLMPLTRIQSPKFTSYSSPTTSSAASSIHTPKYIPPRPILINTADIDVSANRYRKRREEVLQKAQQEQQRKETEVLSPSSSIKRRDSKERKEEKPNETTPKQMDPAQLEQPQRNRSTIKRNRAVVRLSTVRRDRRPKPEELSSPEPEKKPKNTGEVKIEAEDKEQISWREKLAVDLAAIPTYPNRKSPGDLLREKYLIQDNSNDEDYAAQCRAQRLLAGLPRESIEQVLLDADPKYHSVRRLSIPQCPTFHDICEDISSDKIDDDLNAGELRRRRASSIVQIQEQEILNKLQKSSSGTFQMINLERRGSHESSCDEHGASKKHSKRSSKKSKKIRHKITAIVEIDNAAPILQENEEDQLLNAEMPKSPKPKFSINVESIEEHEEVLKVFKLPKKKSVKRPLKAKEPEKSANLPDGFMTPLPKPQVSPKKKLLDKKEKYVATAEIFTFDEVQQNKLVDEAEGQLEDNANKSATNREVKAHNKSDSSAEELKSPITPKKTEKPDVKKTLQKSPVKTLKSSQSLETESKSIVVKPLAKSSSLTVELKSPETLKPKEILIAEEVNKTQKAKLEEKMSGGNAASAELADAKEAAKLKNSLEAKVALESKAKTEAKASAVSAKAAEESSKSKNSQEAKLSSESKSKTEAKAIIGEAKESIVAKQLKKSDIDSKMSKLEEKISPSKALKTSQSLNDFTKPKLSKPLEKSNSITVELKSPVTPTTPATPKTPKTPKTPIKDSITEEGEHGASLLKPDDSKPQVATPKPIRKTIMKSESGDDFWAQIGSRETIYMTQRKQIYGNLWEKKDNQMEEDNQKTEEATRKVEDLTAKKSELKVETPKTPTTTKLAKVEDKKSETDKFFGKKPETPKTPLSPKANKFEIPKTAQVESKQETSKTTETVDKKITTTTTTDEKTKEAAKKDLPTLKDIVPEKMHNTEAKSSKEKLEISKTNTTTIKDLSTNNVNILNAVSTTNTTTTATTKITGQLAKSPEQQEQAEQQKTKCPTTQAKSNTNKNETTTTIINKITNEQQQLAKTLTSVASASSSTTTTTTVATTLTATSTTAGSATKQPETSTKTVTEVNVKLTKNTKTKDTESPKAKPAAKQDKKLPANKVTTSPSKLKAKSSPSSSGSVINADQFVSIAPPSKTATSPAKNKITTSPNKTNNKIITKTKKTPDDKEKKTTKTTSTALEAAVAGPSSAQQPAAAAAAATKQENDIRKQQNDQHDGKNDINTNASSNCTGGGNLSKFATVSNLAQCLHDVDADLDDYIPSSGESSDYSTDSEFDCSKVDGWKALTAKMKKKLKKEHKKAKQAEQAGRFDPHKKIKIDTNRKLYAKEEAPRFPLVATPRPLWKREKIIYPPEDDDSEESDSEESGTQEETTDESDECSTTSEEFEDDLHHSAAASGVSGTGTSSSNSNNKNINNNNSSSDPNTNSSIIRLSTCSNDSGFEGGTAPSSPKKMLECDVNCHKKCARLTANLCGVNQKLIVEALANVKRGAREARDSPSTPPSLNPAYKIEPTEEQDETSYTYSQFQKSGRFTPPATIIPRFKNYSVDDFHFLAVLGKGSFGKVLLAELRDSPYYYAVKCLKKDVVLEDDDVDSTLIERKVLALGTKHPYLCHLFCTFQTESHLFFVMEYLNGGDLMFHIQENGRFTEERARFYGAEIISGLKFLHKKGIIYRDLKLDNVLLDYEGHARIADFGMCKLQIYLDKTADSFCGTPDYMAPEIIKGEKYNQNVDWWSFGVLLYEMLIGQSPFSGCDEDELFWSICNNIPWFPVYISGEATSILKGLLEKDFTKRIGSQYSPLGDIVEHIFFRPIDWNLLEKRQIPPPFKPQMKHPLDTQYFDKVFTRERVRLTPIDKDILQSMDQKQFLGFTYTNPHITLDDD